MTVRPFSRTYEAVQFTKALHALKITRGCLAHQNPSHIEGHAASGVRPAQATLPLGLNAPKATAPGAQLLTLTSPSTLHRPRCLRSQTSSGYIATWLKRPQGHSAGSPVAHFDEPVYPAQATLPQESDQLRLHRHLA